MAVLIYYRRIRESATEVEYAVGGAADNLDRTLIIDKAAPELQVDQLTDGVIFRALVRIIGSFRRDRQWPPHGMIAS
ncbi:hypothetical protein JK358_35300 [Nocardia sp. 2]|uniref:Uncharacterized protein n=1 Tax=Nocardia acididurans TaxID=2802282 RepID=A0ABS1MHD8_9NOCA|nr:hypothetical protein [Nocardia acididurans]MBL1079684.1 hypothetical protein [Nocardia acididurans]